MIEPSELRYDAQGLILAVLQDATSHEVVMVGYMNAESLRQTLELGQAVFWSRSRQELWHKGATSGDYVRGARDPQRLRQRRARAAGGPARQRDLPHGRAFLLRRGGRGDSPAGGGARRVVSGPPFLVSLVLLDVDGTLVDFVGAMRAGLDVAAAVVSERAGGVEVAPERLREVRNEVARDPSWRGRPLWDVRQESFRRALAAFEVDGPARGRRGARPLLPRARRGDGRLPGRGGGADRAAASGTAPRGRLERQPPLAPVGLDGYFEATHYAEDVGVSKPDPAFFTLAVARAEGSAETTLAVGDRLDNDYEPARAAGLHAVLVDRRSASRMARSCASARSRSCPGW